MRNPWHNLDIHVAQRFLEQSFQGFDDGEIFMEHSTFQSLSLENGVVKSARSYEQHGFGLRLVACDRMAYAYHTHPSMENLKDAYGHIRSIKDGYEGVLDLDPPSSHHQLYSHQKEWSDLQDQIHLLREIESYAKEKDPRVSLVVGSLDQSYRMIDIIRPGQAISDDRPLFSIRISVMMSQNNRQEMGVSGGGGRLSLKEWLNTSCWKRLVDDALRQARVNLDAQPAPAGEMTVVLGSGWPGILLHEAIGHGLEGDFNRKKTSAFTHFMGKRIASPGVHVIDDGTLPQRRGSLNVDDEGTPTQRTSLVEDGILVNYMQDRLNGRLMGCPSTGNGRRESYRSLPYPRMTNTFMLNGNCSQEDILGTVDRGIYAVNFSGGQVDIVSGKFVFSAQEAYLVEKGKIVCPVKGVTLIGNGPDVLTKISMIGNDMTLDNGLGTCGKNGQSVPVGVGQPTLKIDGLTIGGTEF